MSNLSSPPQLRHDTGPTGSHFNGHESRGHDVYGDFAMDEELKRLAAINQELLGHPASDPNLHIELPDDREEIAQLRRENALLRQRLEDIEPLLQAAVTSEEAWLDRQKEYESLLEEKSEVIRGLHLKIHEMQEVKSDSAPAPAATKAAAGEKLREDDLLRLKEELEEQRRQLEEDEKSLMQQMRDMELAMARDRAELARHRNELQRLQADLNHEVELASRDPGLRERLQALQRRQPEMARPSTTPPPAQAAPPPATSKTQSSGLLRRLFGG